MVGEGVTKIGESVGNPIGRIVDGLIVEGVLVDGVRVDGLMVEGVMVEGVIVEGVLVEGGVVEGILVEGMKVGITKVGRLEPLGIIVPVNAETKILSKTICFAVVSREVYASNLISSICDHPASKKNWVVLLAGIV